MLTHPLVRLALTALLASPSMQVAAADADCGSEGRTGLSPHADAMTADARTRSARRIMNSFRFTS